MSDIVETGEAATQTGMRRAAALSWQLLRVALTMIGRVSARVFSTIIGAPRQYGRAVRRDRNALKGKGEVTLKHFSALSKGPREMIRAATPELAKQTARELRKHGFLYAAETMPDGTTTFHVRKRDVDTARHALATAQEVLAARAERKAERSLAKEERNIAKDGKGRAELAGEVAAVVPHLSQLTAKDIAGIRGVLDEFAATLDAESAERVRGFASSLAENGKGQAEATMQATATTKAAETAKDVSPEAKEAAAPVPKEVASSKLVAHGAAPYMNDPENKMSYFVTTEDALGKQRTQWAVDLERAIQKSGAQIGDQVRLEKTGSSDVTLPDGATHERGRWQVARQEQPITEQASPKQQAAPVTTVQKEAAPAQTATVQPKQTEPAREAAPVVSDEPVKLTAAESAVIRAELTDYAAMQSPQATGRLERLAAAIQENGYIPNKQSALADVRNARVYAENTGAATTTTVEVHKRVAGALGARQAQDAAKAVDARTEPPAKDPPRRDLAPAAMPMPSGAGGGMSMGGGL
jgi:hypothetical protein